MRLSKREKNPLWKSVLCQANRGSIRYLNTCGLPPGQTVLIKNSQSFLLHSANLIVKFPCVLEMPPHPPFLNNSNTSILNSSTANLPLCTKCKSSKRENPLNNPYPSPTCITAHLFLLTTKCLCHEVNKTQESKSRNPVILHELSHDWKQGWFTSPERTLTKHWKITFQNIFGFLIIFLFIRRNKWSRCFNANPCHGV